MRHGSRTARFARNLGLLVLVVALAVGAWAVLPARLGVLGTRALVIAATRMPPVFSAVLTRALGLGGGEAPRAVRPFVEGGAAPILVITSAANPFSGYLVEILRAEGLNALATLDVGDLTASALRPHDVVVLGEMPVDVGQAAVLAEWTAAGGTFVAMRPDPRLAGLLGLAERRGTVADAYLRVDTKAGPGVGIVGETMQFHGIADAWTVAQSVTVLATLHTDAATASRFPAVTSRRVGSHGGGAVAFTYDLARSVVYTRQGNPAWAGQARLGRTRRGSVDLQSEWLDLDKVAIPQADEQQRLLANVVTLGSLHRRPLPRFWYLPKGGNAAVVMTGDGHDDAGLRPRFEGYLAASPAGCSVEDWECVRATGYLYVGTTLTAAEAARYADRGFEVALHLNTDCVDWTPESLTFQLGLQLRQFARAFPEVPAPVTSRTHCTVWSDWSTQPELEAAHGIRLDGNYYWYPEAWTRGRPGLFTGSGFPMRFATQDGSLVDSWQAATQIPDESGLSLPEAVDELLDRADGPEGYYGVFTTNMHFDHARHAGSDAIVDSARARGVPVVSARQMLQWLDGRNGSSFEAVRWSDDGLRFDVAVGVGARNLRGMVPLRSAVGALAGVSRGGVPVPHEIRTIKGIAYAFFSAEPGSYLVVYRRE